MKKRIGIILALVIMLALTLAYFVAFIPPQTRSVASKTDVNGASFAELYERARKELGLVSGLFSLNHISVRFSKAGERADVQSVQFGFCHAVVNYELYDAYLVGYEKDAAVVAYMREEPKGITNELDFPYADGSVETQDVLKGMMASTDLNIREWVQAWTEGYDWKDGTIVLTIAAKGDGSIVYEAKAALGG